MSHVEAPQQREALIALYGATNGEQWNEGEGWNTAQPLEQWHGVTVDNGYVVKLDLSINGLKGSIPGELGSLEKLEVLSLGDNELTGNIPKELGELTELLELNLGWNKLDGSIPKELGKLQKLRYLYLYENQLTGEIPSALGDLKQLTHLTLLENKLTGSIPPQLGQLSNLQLLWLSKNNLEGSIPPKLGGLQNLVRLGLSQNQLSGNIPPELGDLRQLTWLSLDSNKLSGSIPPELGHLVQLTHLYLHDNQLSGEIPSALGDLKHLQKLWLNDNQLTGNIPPELGSLENLTHLYLYNNNLSEIPHDAATALLKLSALRDVRLHGNPWTSPSADVVAQGLKAVERYWIDLAKGRERWWKLKVVLVGKSGAGKTSLARSLEADKSDLAGKEGDDNTTVGIDKYEVKPRKGEVLQPLELVIWDFAGQQDYYAYHQLFLTKGALYVLTVNLATFAITGSAAAERELVVEWLDTLQACVPGSVVVVVGTHKDKVEGGEEEMKKVKELVKQTLDAHEQRKKTEKEPLKVQDTYFAVDLTDDASVYEVKDFIRGLALDGCDAAAPSRLFPDAVGKTLPKLWKTVSEALAETRLTAPCIKEEDMQGRWKSSISNIGLAVDDPRETFTVAVTLAQVAGNVLRLEGYVHVDPTWLMALVKPLASHRLTEKKVEDERWDRAICDPTMDECKIEGILEGKNYRRIEGEQRAFLTTGTITTSYLYCLWQLWSSVGHTIRAASGEESDLVKGMFKRLKEGEFFHSMRNTLSKHGVILPVQKGGASKEGMQNANAQLYVAPTRLAGGGSDESNAQVRAVLRSFLETTAIECLRGHFDARRPTSFPSGTLPLILASFLAKRVAKGDGVEGTTVEIQKCAKYAAALHVDDVDVCIMVSASDMLLYVRGTLKDCRKIGRDTCAWMNEEVEQRFPGLEVKFSGMSVPKLPVAAELGLLSDDSLKDDAAQFDVFLSHAGPDKWGLVHQLWVALWNKGISAFLDREELPIGGQAPDYMVTAAKKAQIGVVVLSPDFLCRRWCLKETKIFMDRLETKEKGFTVVPLFYRLAPGDCCDEKSLEKYPQVKAQWKEWGGSTESGEVGEDGRKSEWPGRWQGFIPSLKSLAKTTGVERDPNQYDADYIGNKVVPQIEKLTNKLRR